MQPRLRVGLSERVAGARGRATFLYWFSCPALGLGYTPSRSPSEQRRDSRALVAALRRLETRIYSKGKAMSKLPLAKMRRACRMPLIYRNWVGALLNRFGPRSTNQTVTYVLRSGVIFRMRAGSHDIRVLNEVWLDRIYEPAPDFSVRKGWTVLDLGAHKGSFAVRAALAGPTTRFTRSSRSRRISSI